MINGERGGVCSTWMGQEQRKNENREQRPGEQSKLLPRSPLDLFNRVVTVVVLGTGRNGNRNWGEGGRGGLGHISLPVATLTKKVTAAGLKTLKADERLSRYL